VRLPSIVVLDNDECQLVHEDTKIGFSHWRRLCIWRNWKSPFL